MSGGNPATNTIVVDHPVTARIFQKVYEIVQRIENPFLVKVYSIKKNPLRIILEEFSPLERSLTPQEVAHLRDVVRVLNENGIVLTRIVRRHFSVVDGRVKLYLLADAGIVSPTDPYKWKIAPLNLEYIKRMVRNCDFDSYISGVYRLSTITSCAVRRFLITNTVSRKRELEKKKKKEKTDAIRDEFRVRNYIQTGNDIQKIPTPALRRFLGVDGSRQHLQDRLRLERQTRNRARLEKVAHSRKNVLTRDSGADDILQTRVMDPILYQERSIRDVFADQECDYRLLLVRDSDGVLRPTLFENRTPEIMYRCVEDLPWRNYLSRQDYFFNIRAFDGGRYLIPRTTLDRIMVIESSDEVFKVVSRDAIQEMDFTSRLHCQDGSDTLLYIPDTQESQRLNRLLSQYICR